MFIAKSAPMLAVLAAASQEWEAWKQQYGKSYNGADEDDYRRTIFEANLVRAQKLQKANPLANFGATKFSDMSPEEFKKSMLTYRPSNRTLSHADLSHLPLTVEGEKDWSYATTSIKDQGQCGSCWAFSATEQIESDYVLQGGSLIELAPQELNDCTSSGAGSYRGGCSGGDPAEAYEVVKAIGGLTTESQYPYTARDGTCKTPPSAVQVSDWQWVGRYSESQMQSYVATSGTLSVCVDANDYSYYQGGIMTSCGNNVDHCVQIVGIGESGGSSYWKVRNSWGSSWGENGYLRLQIGNNLCDITSEPSKVTVVGGSPTPTPAPTPTPSPSPSPWPTPTPSPSGYYGSPPCASGEEEADFYEGTVCAAPCQQDSDCPMVPDDAYYYAECGMISDTVGNTWCGIPCDYDSDCPGGSFCSDICLWDYSGARSGLELAKKAHNSSTPPKKAHTMVSV